MSKLNWSQLIQDLRGEDIERSVNACQKIDEMADESHIQELYSLLNDESYFVREAVASPLARLEGIKVLPHLFQAYTLGFQDGHDNDGLSVTIVGLLEENKEDVTPLLLEMLQSEDVDTRANAAWALGFTASQIKPRILLELLESESNQKVRLATIGALSSFTGYSEVIEKLLSLLGETDEQVRIDVVSALGYLGDKRAIAPIKKILEESTNGRIHEFAEYALKRLNAL
jgi:HEAT repeat protein